MNRFSCNGQFGQDLFVASIMKKKPNGFFVDIGCGISSLDINHVPIFAMSNTFLLEKALSWNGIALDYDEEYCEKAQKFRSSVTCVDLMEANINDVLAERNCPEHFDYLSLDVDQAQRKVLDELDFEKYSFKILTYEHNYSTKDNPHLRDLYLGDREYSREKFSSLGYKILFGNVGLNPKEMIEDWWVNEEMFDEWGHLAMENTTLHDIMERLL